MVFQKANIQFIRELAGAIGLDPDAHSITSITIESRVKDVARITVEMIMTNQHDAEVSRVLKRYKLDPKLIEDSSIVIEPDPRKTEKPQWAWQKD